MVLQKTCHENWTSTFFKKLCWPEFSRYLKMTPFRHAQVFKESVKKKSRWSDWSVIRFRNRTEFAPFSRYKKNARENVHENVPNYSPLPIYSCVKICCLYIFQFLNDHQIKNKVRDVEKKNNNKRAITIWIPLPGNS